MGWLLASIAAILISTGGSHRPTTIPLYQRLMVAPATALLEADIVLARVEATAHSPTQLFQTLGTLGRVATETSPLAPSFLPRLADTSMLPEPLRGAIEHMLNAISLADKNLKHALRSVPPIDMYVLREQALEGAPAGPGEPDLRNMLLQLDQTSLLQGMQGLVAATEALRDFVRAHPDLPAVRWEQETVLGKVIVNTLAEDNEYQISNLLFVLDTQGNDRYSFATQRPHSSLSVLLDTAGNDRYVSHAPCTDPSCATLGYGILWDAAGNDDYEGEQLAQASALLGAALLVDEAGNNRFSAQSHSQAHAIAGYALVVASPGADHWLAQTHAQASAGPQGIAMLVDPGGDDRYELNNTPLLWPSPQLATNNTSMGQGAGRGYRAVPGKTHAMSGGLGLLVDLAGDDSYTAQVFAQGAGYFQGIGVLIDSKGTDHFDATWYAMGAAAHEAVGLLIKKGKGHDRYTARRSSALGAAHDGSVAYFFDAGGNDDYHLEDFGLGVANDESFAVFHDANGDDRYHLSAPACRGFGTVYRSGQSQPLTGKPSLTINELSVFTDSRGNNHFTGKCKPKSSL